MDKQVFTDVEADFSFKGAGTAYVPAPVKKLLKFNIESLKTTEQIDNFKTKPDGTENPNYGKPQTMFVIGFKLNDPAAGEANGQVYTKWVTDKVSDRSGLGKISDALFGSPTAVLEHKAGELIGLPLQAALKPGVKDPERLVIDIDKVMPATADQTKTVADVLPEDPEAVLAAAGLL